MFVTSQVIIQFLTESIGQCDNLPCVSAIMVTSNFRQVQRPRNERWKNGKISVFNAH